MAVVGESIARIGEAHGDAGRVIFGCGLRPCPDDLLQMQTQTSRRRILGALVSLLVSLDHICLPKGNHRKQTQGEHNKGKCDDDRQKDCFWTKLAEPCTSAATSKQAANHSTNLPVAQLVVRPLKEVQKRLRSGKDPPQPCDRPDEHGQCSVAMLWIENVCDAANDTKE